ncbi:MAG: cytochrome ubiquinol oxidase subunit I [Nitrospirae bacterium CG_4_10_14_3_um_filter_44_29]|nr:cytochrome ubiquinol oxidase subunit I [Nitrospirota bacterium]PIP69327.1 MAG: cytochrome ubiquinol oxidase subunit I [Nitrospirae bacterium CG22_combo_CG10-13_8_21_14_all_44_11]PIV67527.1 MAG: cytochrome ubiquinol oxidase subunit I [Nitrospirae bacterium CG01_land_8_20_14_3_00_44_22]PIX88327.1 MAG: cytochrome ubiquinol oxidase subunit I [Nitrospirae bacterium CG_4_10_14_3_um_filter_44_29]
MDVLTLSRLQFAVTAAFHFIFVPLTLGLSILIAYMESRYVRTNDAMYLKMTKFWGKLFLINFALGIVTGITMEFQFGMNWAEYSKYVGDIFGAPLAIEATVAFFLESTFIGLWVFGWNKVSKRVHALSIWLVAIATNLSALWILLANGWMQNPVGYVLRNNRAEMVDFGAMLTNPYGWLKFSHTLLSGYVVAAFFVMGISAYHLLKKTNLTFFKSSFKMAATFGLMSSLLVFIIGDFHAAMVARTQPAKFAAMESVWETQKAVPYNFLVIPDVKNERNTVSELGIPKLLSLLAFHDGGAEIKGLKEFSKEDRPPVLATFLSFRGMAALGMLFMLLALAGYVISKRDRLESNPLFLRIMLYALPLPYIAVQLGWLVAEVGRQPWIVYGVLRTSDAVSKSVTTAQVWTSLIGFTLFYGMLGFIDIYLLAKYSKKGPDDDLSAIIKSSREV